MVEGLGCTGLRSNCLGLNGLGFIWAVGTYHTIYIYIDIHMCVYIYTYI